jgi:hypothetical protein
MTVNWAGFAVVCMASGPSLTHEDAETVRAWREAGEDRRVIVTNTTYQIAPWADVLFAMDGAWWRKYGRGLEFAGERLTVAKGFCRGAQSVQLPYAGNSGACAMVLAEQRGAKKIIMLGYDCQYTNGKRHWHGDHPVGLGNCVSLPKFPGHFERMKARFKDIEVFNASRETALEVWPRANLEDVL